MLRLTNRGSRALIARCRSIIGNTSVIGYTFIIRYISIMGTGPHEINSERLFRILNRNRACHAQFGLDMRYPNLLFDVAARRYRWKSKMPLVFDPLTHRIIHRNRGRIRIEAAIGDGTALNSLLAKSPERTLALTSVGPSEV